MARSQPQALGRVVTDVTDTACNAGAREQIRINWRPYATSCFSMLEHAIQWAARRQAQRPWNPVRCG